MSIDAFFNFSSQFICWAPSSDKTFHYRSNDNISTIHTQYTSQLCTWHQHVSTIHIHYTSQLCTWRHHVSMIHIQYTSQLCTWHQPPDTWSHYWAVLPHHASPLVPASASYTTLPLFHTHTVTQFNSLTASYELTHPPPATILPQTHPN